MSESLAVVRRLLPAVLSTGESARVVAFDGTLFEFRSPRAFAPGARALLTVTLGESSIAVDVKCHGSKRVDEGVFHVRGRVVSLPRASRDALISTWKPGSSDGAPSN